LLELFNRNEDWLIMVNADPDAMASALALKRILARRAGKVRMARINEITRPDNLAMSRYLRIPLIAWSDTLRPFFQRFALVDSQPHHNPAFADVPFSVVVDHHPLVPEHPVQAAYVDIRPQYGAASAIFAEYLRALRIRPGTRLATALLYGIRTDTGSFTRKVADADIRAYQWLAGHADTALLNRITRSEYLPEWLKYFTRAFTSLHDSVKGGAYAFLGCTVCAGSPFAACTGKRWWSFSGVMACRSISGRSRPSASAPSVPREGIGAWPGPNFLWKRRRGATSKCSCSANWRKKAKRAGERPKRAPEMWHVYLLECADGTFYCGVALDPLKRLAEHNGERPGGARYTRSRRPCRLVTSVEQPDRSAACRLEARVKARPRRAKLACLLEAENMRTED